VPIQLAQCWFPGLAVSNAKTNIFFQVKHSEAILSNSTRKLLWFEANKVLIAVKNNFIVLFYFSAHSRCLWYIHRCGLSFRRSSVVCLSVCLSMCRRTVQQAELSCVVLCDVQSGRAAVSDHSNCVQRLSAVAG